MRESTRQTRFAEGVSTLEGDSVWMRSEDAAGELRSVVRYFDAPDFEFLTGVVDRNRGQT